MTKYRFYQEIATGRVYAFPVDPQGNVKKEWGAGKYTAGIVRTSGISAVRRQPGAYSTGNIGSGTLSLPMENLLNTTKFREVKENQADPLLLELLRNIG